MLNKVIAASLTLLFLAMFSWIVNKHWKNEGMLWQLSVVFGIVSIVYCSAVVSSLTAGSSRFWILIDGCWTIAPLAIVFMVRRLHQGSLRKILFQRGKSFWDWIIDKNVCSGNYYKIFLALFTLTGGFLLLGTVQDNDCSMYYACLIRACKAFDFSPSTFAAFTFASHPAYAFGLMMAPGEFLLPGNVCGAQAMQLLYTIVASWCLYSLIGDWLRLRIGQAYSSLTAFLVTLVCLTTPIFWCQLASINTDYSMVLFFIFLIYVDSHGESGLAFFWSMVVGFTKETGWILVAGYCAFKIIYIMWHHDGSILGRAKGAICYKGIRPIIAACSIGLGFLLVAPSLGLSWKQSAFYTNTTSISSSSDSFNSFGINIVSISQRLEQIFIVNFSWVYWLLIAACLIAIIVRSRLNIDAKPRTISVAPELDHDTGLKSCSAGLIGGLLVFCFAMCLYITAANYRYLTLCALMVSAFGSVGLFVLFNKRRIVVIGAFVCLIGMNVAQAFYPFDPLSNVTFGTVDIGESRMLCFAKDGFSTVGTESFVYNFQNLWIDKALQEMFDEVGYSSDDILLSAGGNFSETDIAARLANINTTDAPPAFGTTKSVAKTKGWDSESNRYCNGGSSMNVISTNALFGYANPLDLSFDADENVSDYQRVEQAVQDGSKRVIVYFSPMFGVDEQEVMEKLSQYFYVGERCEVSSMGGSLSYYIMSRKMEAYGTSDEGTFFTEPPSSLSGSYTDITSDEGNVAIMTTSSAKNLLFEGPSDERVEQYAYALLKSKLVKTENSTRTLVRKGDELACKVRIYIDDVPFTSDVYPDGLIKQYIYVGGGGYLDNLDAQLEGHLVGDTVLLTVTYPSTYPNWPELAGKTAQVYVSIGSIYRELPSLTDSYLNSLGYESMDDLFAKAREKYESRYVTDDAIEYQEVMSSDISVSSEVVDTYSNALKDKIAKTADAFGISYDDYINKYMEISNDSLETSSHEYAVYCAKLEVVSKEKTFIDSSQ